MKFDHRILVLLFESPFRPEFFRNSVVLALCYLQVITMDPHKIKD